MTKQAKPPGPWPGRFVWFDLMTRDAAAAEAFYTGLFGWRVEHQDMVGSTYRKVFAGPGPIGGIIEEAGIPHAHWMPYVAVEDVAAAVAKAAELGGSACVPPTAIPGTGTFAVLGDAEGAYFSVYRGNPEHSGADPDARVPGRVCWNELWSKDTGRALAFYRGMFGWQSEDMPMEPMGTYHMQKVGDAYAAGIMRNPAPDVPPRWNQYFAVVDLLASTDRAVELGGSRCAGPIPVPGMGHFTLVTDPTGAMLALFEALGG